MLGNLIPEQRQREGCREARATGVGVDPGLPAAAICLLQVNGQKVSIPYKPNEYLQVTLRGRRLYLVTDFELVVSFNGRNNAGP